MTLGCDVMNGRSKLTSQQLDVFQFLLLNDPTQPYAVLALRLLRQKFPVNKL